MIKKRAADERGHLDFGWLNTYHTFSFGEYYDPKHMHYRTLRVMNEDRIAPGQGFGKHPHKDMEILTYVISGAIEHKDSMGNEIQIAAGNIQVMSAGTGIMHSEFNPSPTEELHLYQIWMLPKDKGLPTRYDQKDVSQIEPDQWVKIGSSDPVETGVQIMQDLHLYLAKISSGKTLSLPAYRHGWLQVVSGEGQLGSESLKTGDGVAIRDEKDVTVQASTDLELLFFDLS